MTDPKVLVTGAGGFIGGHLVADLVRKGFDVRAVDGKPIDEWHQRIGGTEQRRLDLRNDAACAAAVDGVGAVYNLAADMGGMGFIEHNKARCMLSVLIDTQLLRAARAAGVDRFFYASSACVYPIDLQTAPENPGLRESDAYPAMPEDGYGWQKLFSERMCRHFLEDFGFETRVARYHNVYGPHGLYTGGREKAPAAICRKVIEAKLSGSGSIEIWGDGEQTRTFTYVDDCIHGTQLVANGDVREPVNIGSAELVTINQLVDIVESIAGVSLQREYKLDAPLGVRGRKSDNTFVRACFGWEPTVPLATGMEATYRWIHDQMTS
jgi:nucleoside-diphosphate-sugar epimerase